MMTLIVFYLEHKIFEITGGDIVFSYKIILFGQSF